MQRDPRAVVASQLNSLWVQRRLVPISLRHGLIAGKRIHQVALHAREWWNIFHDILPPFLEDGKVRLVAYEALVKEPEDEMRRVCDFIGERFEPSMLDEGSRRDVPEPATQLSDAEWLAWRKKHHAQARRAIATTSLQKWRTELSDREVAIIEGLCGSVMAPLGYPTEMGGSRRTEGSLDGRLVMFLERWETRSRSAAKRVLRPLRDLVIPNR